MQAMFARCLTMARSSDDARACMPKPVLMSIGPVTGQQSGCQAVDASAWLRMNAYGLLHNSALCRGRGIVVGLQ